MRKIFLAVATCMALVMSTPVMAMAETASYEDDITPHSAGITVSAVVKSNYSVSIPADFALILQETPKDIEGVQYSHYNEYTIGVKGNFASNKKIVVEPSTLVLTDTADANNKINVVVSQPKTEWIRSDVCEADTPKAEYTTTIGKTYANISRAGAYSGTLTFTFRMADTE